MKPTAVKRRAAFIIQYTGPDLTEALCDNHFDSLHIDKVQARKNPVTGITLAYVHHAERQREDKWPRILWKYNGRNPTKHITLVGEEHEKLRVADETKGGPDIRRSKAYQSIIEGTGPTYQWVKAKCMERPLDNERTRIKRKASQKQQGRPSVKRQATPKAPEPPKPAEPPKSAEPEPPKPAESAEPEPPKPTTSERQEQRTEEHRAAEKLKWRNQIEDEEHMEKMKRSFTNIEAASRGFATCPDLFLRQLYAKHPPQRGLPDIVDGMARKNIIAAVRAYHPDRNDPSLHGRRWFVFCREITKILNTMLETFDATQRPQ